MSESVSQPAESGTVESRPLGFLTFTLHAHLPYVVNHGTWPHGIEWLHEAVAETYLPLLRVLHNLERDGIALRCNLNLSPILLEQLAHPVFKAEFPKYLERKIVAAREDEAYFLSMGEARYAETARFWHGFFTQALTDFEALDQDVIRGFRYFNDKGLIEIITCGATHGYMPLLGTDESVRAQIRTAVATHERHIGKRPRGIWAPECGYRPSGRWSFPVPNADGSPSPEPFDRIGVEEALSESDIDFFFVDTHLVEDASRISSPYDSPSHGSGSKFEDPDERDYARIYQSYYVDGQYDKRFATTVFPRDPRTGLQVWSGDSGYPGDGNYLDFHKKRWPGGHRYWSVTGQRVDMADKQPYDNHKAADRVQSHAAHFVHLLWESLQASGNPSNTPIICAPFDAELFGHWWFEGPAWLEAVARIIHNFDTGVQLTSCAEYLQHHNRAGFISMQEGSWGAEGNNHVWMNPDTSWTYTHIYPAELFTRELCTEGAWRDTALGQRIVKQLCRELLLLESSDWQFLITTGAARDYAEARFKTHNDQFNELKAIWSTFKTDGSLPPESHSRLAAIEERDNIFSDIDPSFWATGSRQVRTAGPHPEDCLPALAPSHDPKAMHTDEIAPALSQIQKFLPTTLA